MVINPPSEVPYWEVKGYTSAGFTQLYNVPLASVLDTISNSGMYDVTEIVPYPTFAQVLLNTADVSELIVECGGEFRFVDLVLPSLLEFTIGLPGDDWECDNGVLWLPQIQMVDEVGAISLPRMRFLSQNQDKPLMVFLGAMATGIVATNKLENTGKPWLVGFKSGEGFLIWGHS